MARNLYVETFIHAPMERVWQLTQEPDVHQRWDLRFSSIEYLPRPDPSGPQHFLYSTHLGFGLAVRGTGESLATRESVEGVRTSSLRFGSADSISLISEGSGYWKYIPHAEGLQFLTWYDYRTRWGKVGRVCDLAFRPLIGWATAWSFDRLRLWAERGFPPELVRTCTLVYSLSRLAIIFVWLWHGLVPKLLFPQFDELSMLDRAGVPGSFLPWFGVLEMAMALLGLATWRWRGYLGLTAGSMIVAFAGVALRSPEFLVKAFNPVTLNLAVFCLALTGWFLHPFCAFACRCRGRLQRKGSPAYE